MDTEGHVKSDTRKGIVHKRTIDPKFGEVFRFKLGKDDKINDFIIRISLWHQQQLMGDVFLGQIHLSLSSLSLTGPHPPRSYQAWYSLRPRSEYSPLKIGSMRLLLIYHEDYILTSTTYQPLLNLLVNSITEPDFQDTSLCILNEVSKDRSAMGLCIVNLFLQLNKFEELAHRLITVEVTSTSDPNTLFRGNSVASKVIDEFMKVVGQTYLHRTLQPCIDEIFEVKRSCEIDQSKLSEGENIDLNMTNLLFFVEKLMSAITSSARSCPSVMKRIFHLLRTLSVKQFPEFEDEVRFTSISGFIFLRFFAPAILNPKLFGLRPENPNQTVSRTLLLISKTIQNLGNVGARKRGSSMRKEDFMVPVLTELMDPQHMKSVKNYLDDLATVGKDEVHLTTPYREGYLVKRALARKKISVKNFKRRYFVLSDAGLSYSKARGDLIINVIPLEDMLAVERVDETAFNMKFMLQLIQPERVLYLQAKNSVDQLEWLSALAKACYVHHSDTMVSSVHRGSFTCSQWSCCGSHIVEQPGCQPVSLAIKLLAGTKRTSVERELNKIYRILLDSQERLIKLKDEASKSARSSVSDEQSVLPVRLQMICELIVIIKNLEMASKSLLRKRTQKIGSKELPYICDPTEAYVIK
ncbi:PREDICTED: ras GTPase-activating protein 3-like [Amphimedon queenslandica]|nr:PREDICTED: ras GTPase-activating protein 3-like [Amphimedon queenslandica]|eukprot:XP_019859524.1 PREDICTED: ras GTPase-activating protein 3-like [Amphimedon queenslandica]